MKALSDHSSKNMTTVPISQPGRFPMIRTTTTAADANPGGDIFGGWLLAQMDIAGGISAYATAQSRIVTVGIEAMSFHQPVFIGDEVSFYTDVAKIGTTSITIRIEAWAKRRASGEEIRVTEGLFTYVAINDQRQPQEITRGHHDKL